MDVKDWLYFLFRDNRFGWRFKIANFIMDDYLRENLAIGIGISLKNAKEFYNYEPACKREIDKAIESVNELYEI